MAESLGISPRVHFAGKMFGDEKWKMLSQMDVFFHPSRNEGLPGAVLEAASLGIPCVVSEESNMAGYITEHQAGVALDKNTFENLAIAMEEMEGLTNKGTWEKMSENARNMIRTEFGWEKIAQRFNQVYA